MNTESVFRLVLVMAAAALASCAHSSASPAGPKFSPEALRIFEQWSAASNNRDIGKLMAVFDKDVILSYQGERDHGYEELKAAYEADFKTYKPGTTWKAFPEESHSDGHLMIVVSHWELTGKNVLGIETVLQRIRSVDILSRNAGSWKIIRTINYPEPN